MHKSALPTDATLEHLIELNPSKSMEALLRAVLANMKKCNQRHGSANVRIGISGAGKKPRYLVYPDQIKGQTISDEAWRLFETRGTVLPELEPVLSFMNAFSGLSTERNFHRAGSGPNWSTATQKYEDVAALLRRYVDARQLRKEELGLRTLKVK